MGKIDFGRPRAVMTVARSWPSITLALGGEGPPRRTARERERRIRRRARWMEPWDIRWAVCR